MRSSRKVLALSFATALAACSAPARKTTTRTYKCENDAGCTVTVQGRSTYYGRGVVVPVACGLGIVVVGGCGCGYLPPEVVVDCGCGPVIAPSCGCGAVACGASCGAPSCGASCGASCGGSCGSCG
ncbi:MAG: hypothetical protein ACYDCL_15860 [Myxococcales bacterium]